ncbi:WbqC family protein [Rheinheimera sp. UJ51]|uniref:WbqC family protein n=1 Tax=Rheinheimera sp. UJ51 TaxID=2892446 RepID=UPI001E3C8517|nr:WbqC family protein [Rheinheimera sp. UJ51]MCC5450490.1 WbqC family protein [Rheinheimera sp. UJ51]
MKKIAILQSNYIPWKGYFDIISEVDEFILYDDMQYTRRDWRNRNKIKTPAGLQWLTVPVQVKGKYEQKIKDTLIDKTDWEKDHLKAFYQNYKRAPFFDEIYNLLESIYVHKDLTHLSNLNRDLIQIICNYLNIKTKISSSTDYNLVEGKTERLLSLCQQAGASDYISGPAAREYFDEMIFKEAGVGLHWFDYSGYPEYSQLWGGEFINHVTILDLLFNCGPDASNYMKSFQLR